MSPSVPALRSSSSTPILSVAIVVSLRVVGCYSNDARTTRWPLLFTACSAVTSSVGTRPAQLSLAQAGATCCRPTGPPLWPSRCAPARRMLVTPIDASAVGVAAGAMGCPKAGHAGCASPPASGQGDSPSRRQTRRPSLPYAGPAGALRPARHERLRPDADPGPSPDSAGPPASRVEHARAIQPRGRGAPAPGCRAGVFDSNLLARHARSPPLSLHTDSPHVIAAGPPVAPAPCSGSRFGAHPTCRRDRPIAEVHRGHAGAHHHWPPTAAHLGLPEV
jgi:hypothetical protein